MPPFYQIVRQGGGDKRLTNGNRKEYLAQDETAASVERCFRDLAGGPHIS